MNEQEVKAALLGGKDHQVDLEVPERNVTVKIRPLTNKEWMTIAARRLRGLKMEGDPTQFKRGGRIMMEMEQMVLNNHESQSQAIQTALLFPVLTMEEVYNLSPGTVNRIATKIFEISGLTEEASEKIASFQPEQ